MTTDITHQNKDYSNLIENIGTALKNGRQNIANSINTEIVFTYWKIGRYIIEFEQKGNEKAEYGSNMLNKLSFDLTQKYGKEVLVEVIFFILENFILNIQKFRQCLNF